MRFVTHVQALPDSRLALSFDDGLSGVVDLSPWLERGVFWRLSDPHFFASVRVGEFGEVRWGDDLDLDPDSLHSLVASEHAGLGHQSSV